MPHLITSEAIDQYAEQFSTPESRFLKELNEKTHAEIKGAQMLSGHLQGLFLQMISMMIQPNSVLEIGTYTGYSATCLARGVKDGGLVHTIDIDDSLQSLRDEYWAKEGLQNAIKQYIGSGLEILPSLKEDFDLVFIDADKGNYGTYFDLVIDKIPTGRWMLADNTLFHGEVVLPEEKQSKPAKAIVKFNQKVADDERVEQCILPIRDGLMIIRKKS